MERESQAPPFVGFVEGGLGTESCASPRDMAAAFIGSVYIPSHWPAGSVVERRIVVRDPELVDDPDRYYMLTVRAPGVEGPLLHGYFGRPFHRMGEGGCSAVPDLSAMNGVLCEGPGSVDLGVEIDGQTITLMRFPSATAAIATAMSLERFDPDGRSPVGE